MTKIGQIATLPVSTPLKKIIETIQKQVIVDDNLINIAINLKGKTDLETLKNIWQYLRPINKGGSINYHTDKIGFEQIRDYKSSLDDKIFGVDCEDKAIFTASLLEIFKIPYKFRLVKFNNNKNWAHIYIVTDNNIILDAVHTKFNEEPPNITQRFDFKKNTKIDNTMTTSILGIGNIAAKNELLNFCKQHLSNEEIDTLEKTKFFFNENFQFPTQKAQVLSEIYAHQNNILNQQNNIAGTSEPEIYYTNKLAQDFAYLDYLNNLKHELSGIGNVWDTIKTKVQDLINKTTNSIKQNVFNLKNSLNEKFDKLKDLPDRIIELKNSIPEKIRTVLNNAKNFALNLKKGIIEKFNNFKKNIGHNIAMISFAPGRAAFLALIKLNFSHMATNLYSKMYEGYNISSKGEEILAKWNKFGGDVEKLKSAVRSGKSKKTINEKLGIGEPVTIVAITGFISAATPVILAFLPFLKNFKFLNNNNTDESEITENNNEEENTSSLNFKKILMPIAIGGAGLLTLYLLTKSK